MQRASNPPTNSKKSRSKNHTQHAIEPWHHRMGRTDNYAHYIALPARLLSLIHLLTILTTLHLRLKLKHVPSFTYFEVSWLAVAGSKVAQKDSPPFSSHTQHMAIALCARTRPVTPSQVHAPSARAYFITQGPRAPQPLTSRPFTIALRKNVRHTRCPFPSSSLIVPFSFSFSVPLSLLIFLAFRDESLASDYPTSIDKGHFK